MYISMDQLTLTGRDHDDRSPRGYDCVEEHVHQIYHVDQAEAFVVSDQVPDILDC